MWNMCHDLLQLNRRCKFLRQFAIWLLFLETFDGGALYLGGTAECNLGVGHFHEVAGWSPYHLSQKASNMKYETLQYRSKCFQTFGKLSTPSLSFYTLDDYSITWRVAIEQRTVYVVLCSLWCWSKWRYVTTRSMLDCDERKFLVIASSASPTFQHLRISRKFSCNDLKTPGSVKKRSRDRVLIEADNKGIWWRKHLFSLGNTTLVEPLSSDTLPILPWIKLKRCCGGLLTNWLDLNWLFDGSLPSWWTCLAWCIWSNVQQSRLSLLSLAPCDSAGIIWKQCYVAERSYSQVQCDEYLSLFVFFIALRELHTYTL